VREDKIESLHGVFYDVEILENGLLICPRCNCYLILRNPSGDPDYFHYSCSCCEKDFRRKNNSNKDFIIIKKVERKVMKEFKSKLEKLK